MDMTYSDIVNTLKQLSSEYIECSNLMRDENTPYREKIFNAGLAIQRLQSLKELTSRYPTIARRLPEGTIVDCSDQAIFHMLERQRDLYKQRLKGLKQKIKDGTYDLNEEMALKVERLRDVNNLVNDNTTLNVAEGALDEKKRAFASVLGTAFKYPFHIATKAIEGGARLIGHIASLPVHMVAYPFHLLTKNTPYDGKVANGFGEKVGEFLSKGARIIDNGIKRL